MDYNSYLRGRPGKSINNEQTDADIARIKEIILDYLKPQDGIDSDYYNGLISYLERGGHYMRPLLFLGAARMFGVEVDYNVMKMAAVIELSELAILQYDDVEDHSLLRRGGPTTAKIYGYELAVNFATILHDKTRQLFEDYMLTLEEETRDRLKQRFDWIADATSMGQHKELNFMYHTKNFSKMSMDDYFYIVKRKTAAYSTYGPMQIAAIVAKRNDNVIRALEEIGEPAGISFQINDDILDFMPREYTGKEQYGDLKEGKYTLVMAYAYSKASGSEKELINSIYDKKREGKTKKDIDALVNIVYKTGALEYALGERDMYMKLATSALTKHLDYFGSTKGTIELANMIIGMIQRVSIDINDINSMKIRKEKLRVT